MPIFFKRMKEYTYEKLNPNELPKSSKTTFNWQIGLPWILSAILALFSGYLLFRQPATHGAYRTDFPDVQPYVTYEERTFTGKFYYNEETQMIEREVDPTKPQYAGPPSPEIDAAWAELLRGEFPAITDQEAAPYKPNIKKFPDTGNYHFELDVFHSLHCLNYIRMYVDKDYYSTHLEHHDSFRKNSSHIPDDWGQVHLHHCLDQVVQSVICHADLSPVPMYGWKGVPVFLGVGQTHTCRRWDHIREWMDARNEVYEPLEEE
ncbi:hypothetical protein BDV27DRAFT_163623 [Aspergillus caelatus]|uniref:Tat pathway signal sequence n=1 Tax=Aspergillus caelatus TaxID=61420 RepID=A0A5N6ZMD9_9EURO|nr:uncharacterized protein BDV27DRAFT_163623 [Aspergillus caelatus]KAE8358393.1 hypothetical protein BDV27DRAFT_163623 [Aspergillus caelatus]